MFVEVIYAEPDDVFSTRIELPMGATVRQAIEQSGLLERNEAIRVSQDRLAIFGRRVSADTVLSDGDRVEVLRPLEISAAEARRLRAARRKS